jgi:hypothetical protein
MRRTPPTPTQEHVAEALFYHRFGRRRSWASFKAQKPDVAQVYIDNARVAVEAYEKALTESAA